MKRIIVENASKKFDIGFKKHQGTLASLLDWFSGRESRKRIWAVRDVSFNLDSATVMGLIGPNGSGKSTLLRMIAGIYTVDEGKITTHGEVIPVMGSASGIQDRLSMRDNIYLSSSIFGVKNEVVEEVFDDIVGFSELEDFVDTKLYQFSTGMVARLSFSIALYCASLSRPEILLLDEVDAVGDEHFKKKSEEMIKSLVKGGSAVIYVSHDLERVVERCQKAIWMDKGRIMGEGAPGQVVNDYIVWSQKLG